MKFTIGLMATLPMFASAMTLGMGAFIQQRIARSKPVQIEKLAEIFKGSPSYAFECVETQDSKLSDTDQEALAAFAPEKANGVITFHLDMKKYGFDLGVTKTLEQPPKALPPTLLNTDGQSPASLDCVAATGDNIEPSSCKSLTVTRELKQDAPLGGDYFPEMQITEQIEITLFSESELYMTYRLDYLVRQKGYFGQKVGTTTLTKSYSCALSRSNQPDKLTEHLRSEL